LNNLMCEMFGIDVLMPGSYQDFGGNKYDPERLFPQEQLAFVRRLLDEAGGHTGDVTSLVLWPRIVDAVAPLQAVLWWGQGRTRAERVGAKDFLTYPVGQIVADMTEETSVRNVVHEMMEELLESRERLDRMLSF
jgi:hypothetical protein